MVTGISDGTFTLQESENEEEEEETSEESETDENTFEVSPILIRSNISYKEKKSFWKRLKEKIFGTTQ